MQNCPRCGFEIKSDFGMVNCPSCGELVLLDEANDIISVQGEAAEANQIPPRQVRPPPPPPAPVEIPEAPAPVEDEFDFSVGDIELVTPGEPRAPQIADEQPGGDLIEIAEYGNSEVSQANDGLLMFDVIVEGIDTNELRGAVRDILNDKRFLWNGDSLINSIRNGSLRVSKLNSIKASILVRRLKHLDLRIRWEQYAIIQMGRD